MKGESIRGAGSKLLFLFRLTERKKKMIKTCKTKAEIYGPIIS
jgi:hypothetical protein